MRRLSGSIVVVGALGVGVLGALLAASRAVPHPLPMLPHQGTLPEFSLIDHRGALVSRSTLDGSVWIADFIFTRCAGQCPLMSAQMAKLSEALRDVPSIRFLSFSVDPSYDTPARLASYARSSGVHDDRWRFVTEAAHPGEAGASTPAMTSIAQLAQQGFRLGVSTDGTPEEPITHSVRFVLVDSHGSIRGTYDATDAQAMAQLHTDARRLAQRQ
jgi:protein SCO1/2